jgi:hypothetical protein
MLTRSKYKRLRGEVQAENVIDESVKFLEKDRDELKRINKDLIRCNDTLQKSVQRVWEEGRIKLERANRELASLQRSYREAQQTYERIYYEKEDELNKLREEYRSGIWVFGRRVYGGGESAEFGQGNAGSREGESVDSLRCAVV